MGLMENTECHAAQHQLFQSGITMGGNDDLSQENLSLRQFLIFGLPRNLMRQPPSIHQGAVSSLVVLLPCSKLSEALG